MPKSVQTTVQLSSSQLLARLCSKSFKLGFIRIISRCTSWVYKRQRNQSSICNIPWLIGKVGNSRKTLTSFPVILLKPPTVHVCVCWCLVAQSCLTLCCPVDSSPPGFSVHRVFQARILNWVAISSSKGSSTPRVRTRGSCVSCIIGRLFT